MNKLHSRIGTRGSLLIDYLGIPRCLYYLNEFDSDGKPFKDDRFTIALSNGEYAQINEQDSSYRNGHEPERRNLRIWLPQHVIETFRRNGSRTDYIELYDKFHPPFAFCAHATNKYMGVMAQLYQDARLVDQVGSCLGNGGGFDWMDM